MNLDLTTLPVDVGALHALVRDLAAQVTGERAELARTKTEIDKLRLIIARLQRTQFGRRSCPGIGSQSTETPEPCASTRRLRKISKRPFLNTLASLMFGRDLFSPTNFQVENESVLQSEFNQREYCEAYGVPLGNWRAKFKAEPQTPARKELYRRGGLNHTLSQFKS